MSNIFTDHTKDKNAFSFQKTRLYCSKTRLSFSENMPFVFRKYAFTVHKTHLQCVQNTPLMFKNNFTVHKSYLTFSHQGQKHALLFQKTRLYCSLNAPAACTKTRC